MKEYLSKIWYVHLINFFIIIGASITLDLNGSIYWLPVHTSKIITVLLFFTSFVTGFSLVIFEKNYSKKVFAVLSLILYVWLIS